MQVKQKSCTKYLPVTYRICRQVVRDIDHRIKDRGPRTEDPGLRTEDQGARIRLRTDNWGSRTVDESKP